MSSHFEDIYSCFWKLDVHRSSLTLPSILQELLNCKPDAINMAPCQCPRESDSQIGEIQNRKIKRIKPNSEIICKEKMKFLSFDSTSNVFGETENLSCESSQISKYSSAKSQLPSEKITFRASCRITGSWKLQMKEQKKIAKFCYKRKVDHISTEVLGADCPSPAQFGDPSEKETARGSILDNLLRCLKNNQSWQVDFERPDVDVYFNLTDLHMLLGTITNIWCLDAFVKLTIS